MKQEAGSGAAIRSIVRTVGRVATRSSVQATRHLDRFGDLVSGLIMPNLFMRRGVLFIGYLEAALGLGESLRGLISSVAETGLPFGLYPFNLGVETRFIGGFMADRYDLRRPYRVNVIEMAVDQVPGMFATLEPWKTCHSYNILRTYWELPQAPLEWAPMLRGINEIWVPNEFVGNGFRRIFAGHICVVPPCVMVETEHKFGKEYFGMEQDRFYFIFSFDYFSYPTRKNPLAVVRAFQAAFPMAEKVGLAIKSTSDPDHHPDIKSAILQAAREDQRIKVIDRIFSRDEMLSLIRQSDCYISLHRSEGFGLGMAEAMALGKPVIGTDYSGSGDFLSGRTGFPVCFTLQPVKPGEYVYAADQSWAEPDEASAVQAMRRVVFDRQERECRAAAAKAFVEDRYGRQNVGRIATRRLQEILANTHKEAHIGDLKTSAKPSHG